MLDGLVRGHGFGQVTDPRALQVPDVWWWHVVANHAPHVAGVCVLVAAAAAVVVKVVRALRAEPTESSGALALDAVGRRV
jgi:hypothetical protein